MELTRHVNKYLKPSEDGPTQTWCILAEFARQAHALGRGSMQSDHRRVPVMVAYICMSQQDRRRLLVNQHIRIDMQHGRQSERNCLPTTRLSNCNYITATESHWPRLTLDRRWCRKTLGANGRHDVFGEVHLLERGDRPWDVATLDLSAL